MARSNIASRNVNAANVTDKIDTVARIIPAPFAKGKGAVERNTAYSSVSAFAYIEGKSRAETIDTLRKALGNKPSPDAIEACKVQYVIGRVAFKLADKAKGIVEHIAFAEDVVTSYAAPVKDGVKARPLRKGQKGRRTIEQHKAVRAAEEAWSQVKAELIPTASNAKTQAERNKAKRGTKSVPTNATAPTHSELVKPATALTPVEARQHMVTQAASLLAFANKNAALLPTDMGTAIRAFHKAIAKAEALAVSVDAG